MNYDLPNLPCRVLQKFMLSPDNYDVFSSNATLNIMTHILTVHDHFNLLSENRNPTYDMGNEKYYVFFTFDGVNYECPLLKTPDELYYTVDVENSPQYSKFLLYSELQKLPPATGAKNKVKI